MRLGTCAGSARTMGRRAKHNMPTPENRAVARWSAALTSEVWGGQSYLKVWHIIYRWKALELLYLACELEIERRSLVEEKTQKKSLGDKMGTGGYPLELYIQPCI